MCVCIYLFVYLPTSSCIAIWCVHLLVYSLIHLLSTVSELSIHVYLSIYVHSYIVIYIGLLLQHMRYAPHILLWPCPVNAIEWAKLPNTSLSILDEGFYIRREELGTLPKAYRHMKCSV